MYPLAGVGSKPKLNVYSAPPKAKEMFQQAAKVSGGIGEKMLQKMGWNKGQVSFWL